MLTNKDKGSNEYAHRGVCLDMAVDTDAQCRCRNQSESNGLGSEASDEEGQEISSFLIGLSHSTDRWRTDGGGGVNVTTLVYM